MKVFVTRYALTKGIYEKEVDESRTPSVRRIMGNDSWVAVCGDARWFKIGTDCCATRSSAVARAEEMRVAKIASLKKQIARLEALKWEVE